MKKIESLRILLFSTQLCWGVFLLSPSRNTSTLVYGLIGFLEDTSRR